MSKQVAFDYEKQVWVEGSEAGELRAAQLREELELLRSSRGIAYAQFSGFDWGKAVEACEQQLAELAGGAQ